MRKTRLAALLLAVAMIATLIIPSVAATPVACPVHTAVTEWTEVAEGAWTGGELTTGHYKLTGNQNTTSALTVAAGATVCIDLAGYNITAGAKAAGAYYRVFEIAATGTLVITDSAETDGVISGGRVRATTEDLTVSGKCAGGNIYNAGTLTLYGGIIANGVATASSVSYNNYGGNIYGAEGSVINICGGAVKDGALSKGELCYGTTKSGGGWGGNIYTSGTLNITDGTISGGRYVGYNDPVANASTATARVANKVYGGNISLNSGAVMNMSGGLITGGSLVNNLSTATTSPNTVYAFGGNIYAYDADINITGGTISDGRVEAGAYTSAEGGFILDEEQGKKHTIGSRGGNIYIAADTTLDIENATITGGVAEESRDSGSGYDKTTGLQTASYGVSQGGNIFASSGTITIKNSTISNGRSDYRGGNIGLSGGTVNIVDSQILNGTLANEYNRTVTGEIGELYTLGSSARGADIYASGTITLNISGNSVFAGAKGGNYSAGQSINVRGNTVVNIYGGDLSDKSSAFDGNKTATLYAGTLRNSSKQLGDMLSLADNGAVIVEDGDVYTAVETLAGALNTAPEGSTVMQLTDATESNVTVPAGVTLDLYGNTLTAGTFTSAFDDANVIDSKGTGKLVSQNATFMKTNEQLPINYEGAYYFETPGIAQMSVDNIHKFYLSDEVADTLLDEVWANGYANTGLELHVVMTWKENGVPASKTVKVPSDLIAQYVADWENKMFIMTIVGDMTNVTELACTARVAVA